MIAKLITGNGFGGAVRYSTKYGKDPDGSLHKLLAVSGVTFDVDDNGGLIINPKKVGWDFRQQTLGYRPDTKNYRPIEKPVYHWILSWKEGERKIPPNEMYEVALEFLKRIGFTNTQYVISAHYDRDNQHLHIVANIVNNNGKRIVTRGLIEKAHEVAAAITKERGYAWGDPANEKTIKSAKKPHEKVRYIIEPIIFEALRTSLTEDELVAKLKASHINTIIHHAKDGKRGGISFAYTYRGVEHTFRGSSVDRKLSYGNILRQLESNRAKAEQAMAKEMILALQPDGAAPAPQSKPHTAMPDVIHVTVQNAKVVSLPAGYRTLAFKDLTYLITPERTIPIPEEGGLYLEKGIRSDYQCMTEKEFMAQEKRRKRTKDKYRQMIGKESGQGIKP